MIKIVPTAIASIIESCYTRIFFSAYRQACLVIVLLIVGFQHAQANSKHSASTTKDFYRLTSAIDINNVAEAHTAADDHYNKIAPDSSAIINSGFKAKSLAPPATPGPVTGDLRICTTLRVSWPIDADTGVTYQYDLATDANFTTFAPVVAGTPTPVRQNVALTRVAFTNITGLIYGTTYYFRIRSYKSSTLEYSAYSPTATFVLVSTITSPSIAGQTRCTGVPFSPISITLSGIQATTYQWYSNTTPSNTGGISLDTNNGAQTATYTPQYSSGNTLYYYCIATRVACPETTTSAVSGAFVSLSGSGPSPGSITAAIVPQYCGSGNPDNITSISPASGGSGVYTYKWQANGVDIPGATGESYDPPAVSINTIYKRFAADSFCNTFSESTGSVEVTVFNPGGINGSTSTECSGFDPANITNQSVASGGTLPYTYEWRANGVATGTVNSGFNPGPISVSTTWIRYAKDANCPFVQSIGTRIVTISTSLVSGDIGATTEAFCTGGGDPALITVVTPASTINGSLNYQWRANGVDIPGATADTYNPGLVTVTTTFTRVAKDSFCTIGVVSAGSRVVTVRAAFNPGSIAGSTTTECSGYNQPIITTGTPPSGGDGVITYEWRENGVPILNTNNQSYNPPNNLTVNTIFTRWAKDGTCSAFVQSTGERVITLYPLLLPGDIGSTTETFCGGGGDPALITSIAPASGGSGAYTYQWTANGVDIPGAIDETYDAAVVTANTTFTRVAKDATCSVVSTGSRVVTVRAAFDPGAINGVTLTECSSYNHGQITTAVAPSGGDGVITYEWRENGVAIPNTNGQAYNPPNNLTVNTIFTRWAKDGTCSTFMQSSGEIAITLNPLLFPGDIESTTETFCDGTGNPSPITSEAPASGGTGGYTYQWQANGLDIPGAIAETYDPGVVTATTTFIRIAKDASCSVISTGSRVVTVRAVFLAGSIPGSTSTQCSGFNQGIIVSATPPSGGDGVKTYEWRENGIAIPDTDNQSYNPPNNLTVSTTFTRWAKDGTCSAFVQSAGEVVINLYAGFTAGTIVSGSRGLFCAVDDPPVLGSVTPASGGKGNIAYQWQANGVDIAGATSETYDPAAGNTTTTTYRRMATDGCAFLLSAGSTIDNYRPAFNPGISRGGFNVVPRCYNSDMENIINDESPSGGDGNYTIKWTANGVDIPGATSLEYDPGNLTGLTIFVRWVKDGTCSGFLQSGLGRTVSVHPEFSSGSIGTTTEVFCVSGNPGLITSVAPGSGGEGIYTYEWRANGVAIPGATSASYDPPAVITETTTYTRYVQGGPQCDGTFAISAGNRVVTVDAQPDVPGVFNIISCCGNLVSGSVRLTGLLKPSTINQTGAVSNTYSTTTANYTITGLGPGTYTFTAQNGSCVSGPTPAVVINSPVTTTWDGIAWTSTPNLNKSLVFDADYSSTGTLTGCSCEVKSGTNVVINSGHTLSLTNHINVLGTGTLTFNNNSNLIQTRDIPSLPNFGNIRYKRVASAFKKFDYTYWSAPTQNPSIATTFATWNYNKAYSFVPSNFIDLVTKDSSGNESAGPDGFDDNGDDWVRVSSMAPGSGYIIMGRTSGSFPASNEEITFAGAPNNGIINTPVFLTPGSETDDDWNLIGNPYPSAIDADEFISANIFGTGSENKTIDGTLYFWTHNTDLGLGANLGPGAANYSPDDYAMYTLAGGVGTGGSSSGSAAPSGSIAAGQGFFVEAQADGNVTFKNGMRSTSNSQFFKIKQNKKDRVWLNMKNSVGMFSQQLVGYLDNTTLGHDYGYDGLLNDAGNYINFYSLMDSKKYKIQSRSTFDSDDQVKLGYFSIVSGKFTIGIDNKEGVFSDAKTNVYLEDKILNVVFDLTKDDYTFQTEKGTFDDRFVLKYLNNNLNIDDFNTNENLVLVSTKAEKITLSSASEAIVKILIFDISGKKLYENNKVNDIKFEIENLNISHQPLLLKIVLENGVTVNRKIIY